jgi:phosphoglycerate dehydrogenase-like enzyme
MAMLYSILRLSRRDLHVPGNILKSPSMTSAPDRSKPIHVALASRPDCGNVTRIFDAPRRERISGHGELLPVILTPKNVEQHLKEAAQIEAIFGTWGIPADILTAERFPALKVIFYGAGSVKGFARPLMERGVQVVTAKWANGICVAQFCLGQILLASKGYFRNTQMCRTWTKGPPHQAFVGAGLYGEKIALIGMGAVTRELLTLMKPFQLEVLAVDPYLKPDEAKKLGVKIVSMEEAFAQAYIVSNHLPNLPELKGVLNRSLFASMRPDATFINTGRGAQVNEADLIEVSKARPDITSLLDVTDPEPPAPGSPLYELPNIQLSSHIAGALNDELRRFGDCVIEEFERYAAGQPLLYTESLELLDRMA